jgi:ABC-2 type transport system ATP-binding protein
VSGLSAVVRDGSLVRARTEEGARVVPSVFASMADAGLGVVSATVARPSLDDVYLRYAGRSFESEAVA